MGILFDEQNRTEQNRSHIICQCQQCQNKEYNPLDFIIEDKDFKSLDNERPLGISGHLRVKDEAMSIAECIDSCIDALDELIITYNKSTDNTEEILKEYEKRYQDKIRLYYYKPNIIRYNKDEYNKKYSIIHYLDNYYNFGFVKIKYKYYVKIDADQVYFKEKLLEVREALLVDINSKKNIDHNILTFINCNKIAWLIPIRKLRDKFRIYFVKKIYNKDIDNILFTYEKALPLKDYIVFRRIMSKKEFDKKYFSIELSGFNIQLYNNDFYFINEGFSHFNGAIGDTQIWVPKSENKYTMCDEYPYEIIKISSHRIEAGFFWIHLGPVKRNYNKINNPPIKLLDIINIEWKDIEPAYAVKEQDIRKEYIRTILYDFGSRYFDRDKLYVTKDFYDTYLKNPLKYAINNKNR